MRVIRKLKADGDPRSDLEKSLSRLRDIAAKRGSRTQEWANEIQALSCGKIEAVVDVAGDLSELIEAVDLVASGTNSQESTRRKAIDEALTTNTVWDIINRLRQDCFDLLYWRQVGSALGEAAPKCANVLGVLGDTQRIQASLFEKMDAHRVGAIATAIAKPEITLSYSDGSREIAFEKASEGQRAGALLFMLLEQRGGPLIVDQPEGDLDNKIITDLTDRLHSAKQKRQLVFASHNANIVVNGSSELVGHLEVREDGVRQFECAGAIDDPEVCQVITSTMEGGERAFKDRQEKYGY